MFDFDAGSFSDISRTSTGEVLWEFLNSDDVRIRLETATYLQRPALEGVQTQLLEKFGDKIRGDRWKQMIGRMTRQIMEHNGYALDQAGVRTRVRELFTSAARYKLKVFGDGGSIRSWRGIDDQRVGLLLYDDKYTPLRRSTIHFNPGGGVCVFALPPLYDNPDVHKVDNWSREAKKIAELQGHRHAFIGDEKAAEKLGTCPTYADIVG